MTKKRIAIVVQRYGEEVNGGAELHARWLAEHLLTLAEVHVITTCAVDYMTWEDVYPAGTSILNGVIIHRFPVDEPRHWKKARAKSRYILLSEHSYFDELDWMKAQGPYSTPLLQFIQDSYAYFDDYIFFTYLYATTYFGLPLVSDKAILVPTAHDEPYLYLPLFRPLFHLPRAIAYNTEPERLLINRVTHNEAVPPTVVGIGIDVPDNASANAFRHKFGIEEPFVLYVGRVSESKNVPELLSQFIRYRQNAQEPLKLILAGKANIPLPQHPDIVPIGFVSEQDKFDAIKAAAVVVIPSIYESLSMIALEAWLMGVPVLVNGRCEVLKHQCRKSNGGLHYNSFAEFSAGLNRLLAETHLRQRLGQQGLNFVENHYNWDVIIKKYRNLLKIDDQQD